MTTKLKEEITELKATLKERTKEEVQALVEKYGDPQYKTSELALYDVISVAQQLKAENKKLRQVLKDSRDVLILCTLIDKSGQAQQMVDIIEQVLKGE